MSLRGLDPIRWFVVLGAALAALHVATRSDERAPSSRIVVTDTDVAWLVEAFERTRFRPPTEAELRGLVDRHVRDELLYREATALGLDREDPALRRRVAMKLEYLAKDVGASVEPTDADLQAWIDAHPERYAAPPRRAYEQVYVSTDKRGARAEDDARELLGLLAGDDPPSVDEAGDPILLEPRQPPSTPDEVARQFGAAFADALFGQPVGTWQGPVRSGYGLHLVRVTEAAPGAPAQLDAVRARVRNDLLADRKEKAVAAFVDALRTKYGVDIQAARLKTDEERP